MDPLVIIIILIIGGFILLVYLINKKQKPSDELLEYLKTTNVRLNEQSKSFNERLDNAARVIGDVQKNIGEMSEIGRGMKDLKEFLAQYLPKQSFHLQYTFKSGEKVDAAIKTTAGIIPVDSKFPMENFRKM